MLEEIITQSYNKVLGLPSKELRTVTRWTSNSFTRSVHQTNFSSMERIAVDPDVHFGKPVIKGTRITVEDILELISEGVTPNQIIKEYYPELTKEDVQACLQYAIVIVNVGEKYVTSPST